MLFEVPYTVLQLGYACMVQSIMMANPIFLVGMAIYGKKYLMVLRDSLEDSFNDFRK